MSWKRAYIGNRFPRVGVAHRIFLVPSTFIFMQSTNYIESLVIDDRLVKLSISPLQFLTLRLALWIPQLTTKYIFCLLSTIGTRIVKGFSPCPAEAPWLHLYRPVLGLEKFYKVCKKDPARLLDLKVCERRKILQFSLVEIGKLFSILKF